MKRGNPTLPSDYRALVQIHRAVSLGDIALMHELDRQATAR